MHRTLISVGFYKIPLNPKEEQDLTNDPRILATLLGNI